MTNRETAKIWKPFFIFITQVKLPYLWIILSIIIAFGQTKLSLLFPEYTQKIMAGDISQKMIVTTIIVVLGQAVLTSVSQFIGSVASAKVSLSVRGFIWKKIIHLPLSFFDKNQPNELISRTTNDTLQLSDFFANGIANALSSLYQLIGTFVILFHYNWRLAAAESVIVPLIYLIGVINGRISFRWNNKIQASLANLTEYLSEILLNIPLIKTFVKEESEERRGVECIDKILKTKLIRSCLGTILGLLMSFTNVLQTILVIVTGIYLISKKIITIDVWIAFYMYAQGLSASVTVVMNVWLSIKTSQGAVRRITEVAVQPEENYNNLLEYKKQNSDITFEQVTFNFSEKNVLNNLSFKIPNGKTTAIVGPSGVGKTTILKLLERFYKPDSGRILVGDKSISDYTLKDWRMSLGYVSQDIQLFSGTVLENILYGIEREVRETEIIEAAKKSCAFDFITALENGFDTQVGEGGSKLSGGQKQRIALCRAILKDTEYLLLDEVTSSLDAEAEYMVEEALKQFAVDRTTIVIAHRLSTIEQADQIIVFDNNKVIDIGNHKDLVESNKFYRQLIEIQQKIEVC